MSRQLFLITIGITSNPKGEENDQVQDRQMPFALCGAIVVTTVNRMREPWRNSIAKVLSAVSNFCFTSYIVLRTTDFMPSLALKW